MTYMATIQAPSGRTKKLRLGRQSGVQAACRAAERKCPIGWTVIDVRPVEASGDYLDIPEFLRRGTD